MPRRRPYAAAMAASPRTTLQRWLLVALALLALSLLVLAGSGVALARSYRPTPPAPMLEAIGRDAFRGVDRARSLHRAASQAAVASSVLVAALAVAAIVERSRRTGSRRRWATIGATALVPVLALAASFTGFLLPWDQLAITKVTVGAEYKGVLVAFRDDVRYVIISGTEIGLDTYRRWTIVHLVVLPALVVAAGIWLVRLTRPSVTELQ